MTADWEYPVAPPAAPRHQLDPAALTIWRARGVDRRRAARDQPAYRPGMRVIVTGPFDCRRGPGLIRTVTRGGRGAVIIDLDDGHDVCVARRYVTPTP